LAEINLPRMAPGSSIMPGKVNPIIPEVVNQVAFQVIGNDVAVTMAAEAGQLELNVMEPKGDLQHLEFDIPARGIIGLRNNVLTATGGEAIMTHRFSHYAPFKGEIPGRINGSLISMENGPCTAYAIDKLQDRGYFFVDPGEELYEGQVIGEHSRENDLVVNIQKGKKLTNMRAAGSDNNAKIAPARKFSLEEAMEYIQKDEYLEVTPESIRMRKILLTENERKRAANAAIS
jgi:GTP-binding protein